MSGLWSELDEPETQRPWAIGLAVALALAVVTTLIAFGCIIGAIGSIRASSVAESNLRMGYLLWLLLVLAAVFAVMAIVTRASSRGTARFWLGTAVAGYVFNIFSWSGSAIGIRSVLGLGDFGEAPGLGLVVLGWILDLALWLGTAAFAIKLGKRHTAQSISVGRLS